LTPLPEKGNVALAQGNCQNEMKPIVWRAILTESILIGLAWGIGYLVEIPPWQEVNLSGLAIVWGVAAALPLLGGMMWSMHTRWRVLAQLRHFVQERVVPLFAGCSLLEMALIAILAGVGEELLFRGLLQTGLISISSLWIGLLISSVIFGLLHFISLLYAFLAALIGLYLGLLFVAFDNLAVPMIVHALYDFVALVYLVRLRSPVG
jgi:membrane protease YdiL (CAAX protease family)